MIYDNNYFVDVLNFLIESEWLYNTAVTDLLSKGILNLFPNGWLTALKALGNEDLNDLVTKRVTEPGWSITLKHFVERCKRFDLLPVFNIGSVTKLPQNFQVGLSFKKQHEIIHLAQLVHLKCTEENIRTIVDLGAGLGYVCQLLHYLYGYCVLGLEKNQSNVDTACSRQKKMYPDSLKDVKFICCDLTCNSVHKIETILHNEFKHSTDICLIGLHACGDLSIHASRIFKGMEAAKLFIMVPCCYHKLSIIKTIKTETLTEKQYFNNFPLSDSLKAVIKENNFDAGLFLRQPFLRLACQEPADRWINMSVETHEEHSFHVLARAILQLYTVENELCLKKRTRKGTRKSQCTNFETYVKDALSRYILKPQKLENVEEQDIQAIINKHEKNMVDLWNIHQEQLQTAEIYSGLQLMLQAPAESLVLQDRLCWMQEQGFETMIIPVMNRRLSPRSCAIVSRKR